MYIMDQKQRYQDITDELRQIYINKNILKRRLLSPKLINRRGVEQQYADLNERALYLENELSYESDDDKRPRAKKAKRDISPVRKTEGGAIHASLGLPQTEKMNLFGVGDILQI
jgi:hypothetical protein